MAVQLPQISDDCNSGQSRILTWIRALEPNSPDISKGQSISRQRPCERSDRILGPPQPKRVRRATGRPLAPTSGNIMPSRTEKSKTTQGERRVSPRKQQPSTPSKPTRHADQEIEEQDQETPKPQGSMLSGVRTAELGMPRAVRLPPPVYSEHRPDNEQATSPSRSSFSSGIQSEATSSARSTSPTKQLADLLMAQRPTKYQALDGKAAKSAGGVLDRYKDLVQVSHGIAVIPNSLRPFVEQNLQEDDWPPTHAYITQRGAECDQSFGQKVLQIHKNAEKCEKEGLSEAEWNSEVHFQLYKLVAEQVKYEGAMGCMNITTARIQPKALSMTHANGMKMSGKMVDFAIYIEPDAEMEDEIRKTLRSELKEAQSLNQTMYGPLRMRPIAISVETKLPFTGGETADIQLATWAGAGLKRMREMLAPDVEIPTIPTLSAHGHDLHLVAFQEKVDRNMMYGKFRLGSTDTLLGTFQMIKSLDILVDWANTEYRSWYIENIIRSVEGMRQEHR